MKQNESLCENSERHFIRIMLCERLWETHPGKAIPPYFDEQTGKKLSLESFGNFLPLLEDMLEVFQAHLPKAVFEKCSGYSGLPRSKRRATIKAYSKSGKVICSVSSIQLKDFQKGWAKEGFLDSLSQTKHKTSFLDGLYLYFSKGRFNRSAYLSRFPSLWHQPTKSLIAYLDLLPAGGSNGSHDQTEPEYLRSRTNHVYGETGDLASFAGETILNHPQFYKVVLEGQLERLLPVSFVKMIENLPEVISIGKTRQLENLDKKINSRETQLGKLKEEIQWLELRQKRSFDYGYLDPVTDLGPFEEHLKQLINVKAECHPNAKRALHLLDIAKTKSPNLKWFRPLEQVNPNLLEKLSEDLASKDIHFRYYSVYNFRPNRRVYVWLAWDILTSCFVVINSLLEGQLSKDRPKRFAHEMEMAEQLAKENKQEIGQHSISDRVVKLLDKGVEWFVLEYASGGDLASRIRFESSHQLRKVPEEKYLHPVSNPFPNFRSRKGWPAFRTFFVETANTLALLEQLNLTHREVQPSNLLFDYNPEKGTYFPILSDLDRVLELGKPIPPYLQVQQHNPFDAPECLSTPVFPNPEMPNPRFAVYSLAAIIMAMFLGKTYGQKDLIQNVKSHRFSKRFRQLLLRSLSEDPEERYYAREFAAHLEQIKRPLNPVRRQVTWAVSVLTGVTLLLGIFAGKMLNVTAEDLTGDYSVIDQAYVDEVLSTGDTLYLENSPNLPYLMSGRVCIDSGKVLYIYPGTTVECEEDVVLFIRPQAQIIAEGTSHSPILFTDHKTSADSSRIRPGSWGGIVIEGQAPVYDPENPELWGKTGHDQFIEFCDFSDHHFGNYCRFGGNDPDDNSGILRYLIIENGGLIKYQDQEINTLTLAGVGRRTILENIMVCNSEDDAIEIFGGNAELWHTIIVNARDDAFDLGLGYSGQIERALVITLDSTALLPNIHLEDGKNTIEIDQMPNQMEKWPFLKDIWAFNYSGLQEISQNDMHIPLNLVHSTPASLIDSMAMIRVQWEPSAEDLQIGKRLGTGEWPFPFQNIERELYLPDSLAMLFLTGPWIKGR